MKAIELKQHMSLRFIARAIAALGLVLVFATAIILVTGERSFADDMAKFSFYLLICAVISVVIMNIGEIREKNKEK